MIFAKCLDFFTPPPLSAFGSDLYYKIHATYLTTSAFPWPPLSLRCRHHTWRLPSGRNCPKTRIRPKQKGAFDAKRKRSTLKKEDTSSRILSPLRWTLVPYFTALLVHQHGSGPYRPAADFSGRCFEMPGRFFETCGFFTCVKASEIKWNLFSAPIRRFCLGCFPLSS